MRAAIELKTTAEEERYLGRRRRRTTDRKRCMALSGQHQQPAVLVEEGWLCLEPHSISVG